MWTIDPLGKQHDRKNFECGVASLDDWLLRRATQWTEKGLSRVFVATRGDSNRVRGYYTLSSHYVEHRVLPARVGKPLPPNVHVPSILLGRLAVDRSCKGCGLGTYLLLNAMARSVQIAERTGVAVFEVDALDDRARGFYLHHGLRPLEDDPHHLFLSMQAIRKLGLPSGQ